VAELGMAKRRFKSRTRKSEFRDAKLIIIATEGTKTERKYFTDLALDGRYRNPKVHVNVLENQSTASSPDRIIRKLDEFRRKYNLDQNDELWLVIDIDKWHPRTLRDVAQQCEQKRYNLAVSTPCFEIWLLLHHKSLNEYTKADLEEFLQNEKSGYRTRLEIELMTICGSYSKSKLNSDHYIPYIETAIQNAEDIDTSPDQRWLNELGTRVYLLAKSIISTSPDR
jgi:hypothetical protein